jgi:signal transduction histidine kinase
MPVKQTPKLRQADPSKTDLAAAKRELKKETARRQAAERSLKKSKERATELTEQSRLLREQLQLLSRQLLLAQEEERKRISRELHDVIAQMLAGINIQLAALKIEAAANSAELRRKISSTQKLVEQSVDVIRRFACELRPPVLDDLGLIPALHSYMKSFTEETGVRVSLTAFAGVEKLSMVKRLVLYRVVQEGLTNVARHAHASRVEVSIKKLPDAVLMQIRDNGKSFDANQTLHSRKNKPLGLIGMRERTEMVGGKFTIESAPGKGTTLHIRIPSKPTSRRAPNNDL